MEQAWIEPEKPRARKFEFSAAYRLTHAHGDDHATLILTQLVEDGYAHEPAEHGYVLRAEGVFSTHAEASAYTKRLGWGEGTAVQRLLEMRLNIPASVTAWRCPCRVPAKRGFGDYNGTLPCILVDGHEGSCR